jgi:hypothetical protein
MNETPDVEREDGFSVMRRVVEAGLWLVEHGLGRTIVMPYTYATGHWRCELHPIGRPSQPYFRYSEAQGRAYLENHGGGIVSPNISARDLARAILDRVPQEVQMLCAGVASLEVVQWVAQVREALAAGFLPSAFGEYQALEGRDWTLTSFAGRAAGLLPPMPGYVPPGEESCDLHTDPWREGLRTLRDCARAGAVYLAPAFGSDPDTLSGVAADLNLAMESSDSMAQGPLLAAAIGLLQARALGSDAHERHVAPGSISTAPAADLGIRRGTRLLTMVHELHKAGYQRLRIVSGWTDEGHWRARLLSAKDVAEDGWSPLIAQVDPVDYVTRDGTFWFGWQDAQHDDARSLALKFLERHPVLSKACAGEDWAYAGWFSRVLGRAENGELPVFFGLRSNLSADREPPPPMHRDSASVERSPTGVRLISNRSLTRADLPAADAEYDVVWPFCLSHDGCHGGLQSVDACFAIANHMERLDADTPVSVGALRTSVFIVQRKLRNLAESEYVGRDHPDLRRIHRLIDRLRELLPS